MNKKEMMKIIREVKNLTKLFIITFLMIFVHCLFAQNSTLVQLSSDELRVRDPFIWADTTTKTYLMYQSSDLIGSIENLNVDSADSYYDLIKYKKDTELKGVVIYKSKDLKNWEGPITVMNLPEEFWGRYQVWAPEMHEYKGKYYLFATITSRDTLDRPIGRPVNYKRGTQIFIADSPYGPFEPFENSPTTPNDWMTLDGTLFIENGIPYMVFCHEWIQITNGSIDIIRLTDDLKSTVGKPTKLFSADEAPWTRCRADLGETFEGKRYHAFVSDAPWFYRSESGELFMLWSSYGKNKYTQGIAYSESGSVFGPWKQIKEPLYTNDGGHAMIFETFSNKKLIAIHQPNRFTERLRLFEFEETENSLRITAEYNNH